MGRVLKLVTALAASASLLGSTTAIGAAPAPASQGIPTDKTDAQQPDSWMMLAALSPGAPQQVVRSRVVATLGAAQAGVTPASRPASYIAGNPLLSAESLAFGLWFGLIAIALWISNSSGGSNASGPTPNSPT